MYKILIFSIVLTVSAPFCQAEVAVISNPSVTLDSLESKEVKRLFLGKTRILPGVRKIVLVDHPEGSSVRDQFYKSVAQKNPVQLRAYWARRVFSGKGVPPEVMTDGQMIVDWVAKTPGAIAYVDASHVDDSVKVLLRIK